MIFKQLALTNYGLYRDAVFDLRPTVGKDGLKNIVLFGGKNGSGKTTLLEAIRLCLYGQRSRGARVRRKDYEAFLKGRIHRPRQPGDEPLRAVVALEFEHVHAGEKTHYRVERCWRDTGSGIDEEFRVLSPDQTTDSLLFDQEHWEQFIQELLPLGVSQLFFFDGEKIQGLAEEEGAGSELAQSMNSLLGLDLAKRLEADLSTYLRRQDDTAGASDSIKRRREIEEEIESEEMELVRLKQERAQTESRVRATAKTLEDVERKIAKEGGTFARHREELIAKRAMAEEGVSQIHSEIRMLSDDLLPFALIPEICDGLRQSLLVDKAVRRELAVAELLEERMEVLKDRVRETTGDDDGTLTALVERNVREVFLARGAGERGEPLHPLSPEAADRLLDATRRVRTSMPSRAKELLRSLERNVRILNETEAALEKAPDDDVLRPLLSELRETHSELAALEGRADEQDEGIRTVEARIEDSKRERRRETERLKAAEGVEERVRLVAKVQSVLDSFGSRVKAKKVEELGTHFKKCFAALARKDDLVREVEINPETFQVTFLDDAGRILPKDELSAGEKQIYAIAILWALARTSRRPLPFVIDTPLGRLDSEHRANLVREYFPHVAHQVVILSTDTEIDRSYFEELQPHIARAYHLRFDGDTNSTEVDTGYFWEAEAHERDEVESTAA